MRGIYTYIYSTVFQTAIMTLPATTPPMPLTMKEQGKAKPWA